MFVHMVQKKHPKQLNVQIIYFKQIELTEVTISPSNRTTKSSGVDPNGLVSTLEEKDGKWM